MNILTTASEGGKLLLIVLNQRSTLLQMMLEKDTIFGYTFFVNGEI